jgi:UDP-hydrolysing UDP-N-acetyl-D-glucosamine 2-epimerase
MRTVGVVTVARSDYGIYLPVLKKIQAAPDLDLRLFVTGMHLSPEFGMTVSHIEADGFPIASRIEMLLSSDTPQGLAKAIGVGVLSFAQEYDRVRPDILLVLGDRFEMFAAAVAAMPYTLPIAHLHGGEGTEGQIDESIRHAITKMSHLHFVSTEYYRDRIIRMGEEPWRVIVSGAPGLDNVRHMSLMDKKQLEAHLGLSLHADSLLVTFHPVTLEYEDTAWHITELLAGLEMADRPVIFTYPNADTRGRVIIEAIELFVKEHESAKVIVNIGTRAYFSLLKCVKAMVGNSSSGIIEAASFKLPVVNIGSRQRGRIHGKNVIHAGHHRSEILEAIRKATAPTFKASLAGIKNPYGDGCAAEKIVHVLQTLELNSNLILKRFYMMSDKST